MRKDSRLSRTLHVLIHLDQYDHPITSDVIAAMIRTNPVVVRRTMGALRDYGYVASVKGHNGGWTLTKSLASITLLDIHRCLGENNVFTIGLTDEHSDCLIEKSVNKALAAAMNDAEAILLRRFGEVTLSKLSAEFSENYPKN